MVHACTLLTLALLATTALAKDLQPGSPVQRSKAQVHHPKQVLRGSQPKGQQPPPQPGNTMERTYELTSSSVPQGASNGARKLLTPNRILAATNSGLKARSPAGAGKRVRPTPKQTWDEQGGAAWAKKATHDSQKVYATKVPMGVALNQQQLPGSTWAR